MAPASLELLSLQRGQAVEGMGRLGVVLGGEAMERAGSGGNSAYWIVSTFFKTSMPLILLRHMSLK